MIRDSLQGRISRLSLKTLALGVLASIVAFVIATVSILLIQRHRLQNEARQTAETTVAHNRGALSQALWSYDQTTLQAILNGMAQSGSIVRVELLDRGRSIAAASRGGNDVPADRLSEIDLRSPDDSRSIGQLVVSESYGEIRQNLLRSMLGMVVAELLQIIGLSAVLFLIVHRLITRHLTALAHIVRHLGVGDGGIVLPRRRRSGDEIDVLVDAFNRFRRGQIDEQRRAMRAESALRERVSQTEATLGALSTGVIALDAMGRVIHANNAAHHLLGLAHEDTRDAVIWQLFNLTDETGGRDRTAIIAETLADGGSVVSRGGLCLRPRQKPAFNVELGLQPVRGGGDVAMILVFQDISNEIARERQVAFLAFHDALTRLGNRALLTDRLPDEIVEAEQRHGRIAVFYVDLDNFKHVNDNLGHAVGDQLLVQVGDRLRALVPEPGWITRQGGDSFIVVLPEPGDESRIHDFAEQLLVQMRLPFTHAGTDLRTSCSVGISLFPDHGTRAGELVIRAEMGMLRAKKLGRNGYSFFGDALAQAARERVAIVGALGSALPRQELRLVFQPLVDIASSRIVGAEALLRWDSAQLGSVSPAAFIPVAEETGLIIEIGDWVLREGFRNALRWQALLATPIPLSLNVSALQFQHPRFMTVLRQLRDEFADRGPTLTLEITETALAGDVGELIEKMHAIRSLGYRISVDDFGTGYSSLSYLAKLPIDSLKIDREFIRELHRNPKSAAVVAAIIRLGRDLGVDIVAEGIDDAEALRMLTSLGCTIAQGFLYSPGLPESQFLALVNNGRLGGQFGGCVA